MHIGSVCLNFNQRIMHDIHVFSAGQVKARPILIQRFDIEPEFNYFRILLARDKNKWGK